jgi:F-type H+-transporting ATPase subunit alpha
MLAASEVSSILESRIVGSSVGSSVEETGRVLGTFLIIFYVNLHVHYIGVGDGIGHVWGLKNVQGLPCNYLIWHQGWIGSQ